MGIFAFFPRLRGKALTVRCEVSCILPGPLAECSRGPLQIAGVLCATLSSPALLSAADSSSLRRPWMSAPSTKGSFWVLPGFLLPALRPENSLGSKLGQLQAHLVCLPPFRNHCPSSPDVQCFESCHFMYFVQIFSCFSYKGTSDPCYSVFSGSGSPAFS